MATFLSASNLSFRLGNGDYLFQNISFCIQQRLTAIVGANGVGKSMLGRCISGELVFDSGNLQLQGRVHYVPQGVQHIEGLAVIDLFHLAGAFSAAQRVENGSVCPDDIAAAQAWWEESAALVETLRVVGLQQEPDWLRPVATYSGGEQFRLMWAAALMMSPDLAIFDEPTNHLDRAGRAHFFNWISEQQRPFLVISHDRELLNKADAILEMTSSAIYVHPGCYQSYLTERDHRWSGQKQALNSVKKEQQRQAIKEQQAFEKQQQRAARGRTKAEKTGLDKMLRDTMKQSAENSQGQQKLLRQQRENVAQYRLERVKSQQEWDEPLKLDLPQCCLPEHKVVLSINGLVTGVGTGVGTGVDSGIGAPNHGPISTVLKGPFRLRINGANGIGKSLLMKTLANQLPPIVGDYRCHVPAMHLDQHFYHFDPELSAIENLLHHQPSRTDQEGRQILARVRLRNKKADIPFGQLSGGEQLKTVLATELMGGVTPQLILLDEPTNHLDMDSTLMLEQALSHYQGALIVISHDELFVNTLNLTHQLNLPSSKVEVRPS